MKYGRAVDLLKRMIAIPSLSRSEEGTAALLGQELRDRGITPRRVHNNVWAVNSRFSNEKKTLLLNSHHDTVKPNSSYTRDPFLPIIGDGQLYGLGSNDAGASVVALTEVFTRFYDADLPFNLLLALSAEEEVTGEHGMRALLPALESEGISIDMGIVGEPTSLQPAVAERGLVVLDCKAHGVAGHAARNEGTNAIYKAMADIQKLLGFRFDHTSPTLGPIKISVTQINAGTQHNVVPSECTFVVDLRTTDAYTNEQVVETIASMLDSDVKARSTRIRASVIEPTHPLVQAAIACGGTPFVSPTTSDMAVMPGFPTLKIGPGDSARSHSADEYVLLNEISDGIGLYENIIRHLVSTII